MDASPLDLPMEYEVIGECVDDATQLLLLGADGSLYALSLRDGRPYLADPTRVWMVDATVPTETLRHLVHTSLGRRWATVRR